MHLDLSSLEMALASLGKAIERSAQDTTDEEIRDAVIQRFEYTYELCWKMLKRKIEMDHPNPAEVDQMSFKVLLREGAERGIVDNVEKWMGYREQRNITAHTYDQRKAESVYNTVLEFFPDARELFKKLGSR